MQREKLLAWAEAQIGTTEDPKGSNRIRYNTAYYGREVSGEKYPWCVTFIWCGFQETGLSRLFYDGKKTASCTALMRWAQSKGLFVTSGYKAGDLFLYDWDGDRVDADHIGIYTGKMDANGGYIVIEGNTNDAVKRLSRSGVNILGAVRPLWDEEPSTQTVTLAVRQLSKGDTGKDVEAMQTLLEGLGFSCGRYGCDGDFGPDTANALKDFQKWAGISVDGICGKESWGRLVNG